MKHFKRPPELRAWTFGGKKRVVLFAGGGGTCQGQKQATGRSPDVAINHSAKAIAMHKANHPETKHYTESVHDVDPVEACDGKGCDSLWLSPDCTYHSKARGGKPHRDRNKARRVRGLAGVALKWAKTVRPRVIFLENVEEWQDWGPLGADNLPDPARRGESFRKWVATLRNLGYAVEWRELVACDYGAPTKRKRLFVIARCDGQPIVWPDPTHGEGGGLFKLKPYRTAAECIDFSIPSASIFLSPAEARVWAKVHGRGVPRRPLADKTLARIARGVDKFIVNTDDPFIVGESGDLLVAPSLIQTSYGERKGQAPRILDIHEPLGTIVAGGIKHSLVAAYLAKHHGGHEATGQKLGAPADTICTRDQKALVAALLLKFRGTSTASSMRDPAPTITASGNHLAEVRAFLMRFNGQSKEFSLKQPIGTLDTNDRYGLVMVHGVAYVIVDITMRMLVPRELFRCTGFPEDYEIENVADGIVLTQEEQTHMVGNAVPPAMAEALFRANLGNSAQRESA